MRYTLLCVCLNLVVLFFCRFEIFGTFVVGNTAQIIIKYYIIYETIKQKITAGSGYLWDAPRDCSLCFCKLLGTHLVWQNGYDHLSV